MPESLFSPRRRNRRSSWQAATPQRCPNNPNTGLNQFSSPGFLAAQARANLTRQTSIAARSQDVNQFIAQLNEVGSTLDLAALLCRCRAKGFDFSVVVGSLFLAGWKLDTKTISISRRS